MVGVATCWRIASTSTYVHVPAMFLTANGSRRLEVSRTCLSYKGRPDGLTASDARLEFETAQRYFDFSSHLQASMPQVRIVGGVTT